MSMLRLSLFASLLLTAPLLAQEVPPPVGASIVEPQARLELLFTRSAPIEGGLTEGPAAAPDGSIYFSDIPLEGFDGMILRFDPRTRQTSVFARNSFQSNGLFFDAEGKLIACEGAAGGGRGIARWDTRTGERTVLVDRYKGKRFNSPNDVCLDAQGRIYFTDPRYVGSEPREIDVQAVYRIDTDGHVEELTRAVSKPNGIALSPDEKTLYVVEHDNGTDRIGADDAKPTPGKMRVVAFPFTADGKIDGAARTLVDFGQEPSADGITVDAQGNVYLTCRSPRRPGVMVVTPTGREIAFIATGPANQHRDDSAAAPTGLPSNVEFGVGDDAHTLYITVDTSLYRIRVLARGPDREFGARGAN
ncbi:MAG: SMP-30/gluconolactonase/LRE family protein [Planctomycetales bacterium]|nr:SMP-30/gluconolactonase/LRE family protein [Planctomycetales bacterium]